MSSIHSASNFIPLVFALSLTLEFAFGLSLCLISQLGFSTQLLSCSFYSQILNKPPNVPSAKYLKLLQTAIDLPFAFLLMASAGQDSFCDYLPCLSIGKTFPWQSRVKSIILVILCWFASQILIVPSSDDVTYLSAPSESGHDARPQTSLVGIPGPEWPWIRTFAFSEIDFVSKFRTKYTNSQPFVPTTSYNSFF